MKTKKKPIWVAKDKLQAVKDLLQSKQIPYWGEYGVFYFNFGTAVVTAAGLVILALLINWLN
jgi:hypothetical protein